MSAYAGSGKKGYTDGCGPNASFNCPMGIAFYFLVLSLVFTE